MPEEGEPNLSDVAKEERTLLVEQAREARRQAESTRERLEAALALAEQLHFELARAMRELDRAFELLRSGEDIRQQLVARLEAEASRPISPYTWEPKKPEGR